MKTHKYTIFGHCVLICHIIFPQVSIVLAVLGPNIKPVNKNEFPFVVGIVKSQINFYGQKQFICTATLISRRDILTSAHCFVGERYEGIEVIVGSIDITAAPNNGLKWWKSFEQWAAESRLSYDMAENDITIGRLKESVSRHRKIAKLKYMPWRALEGKYATAVGWGKIDLRTFPRILHKLKVKILPKPECERRLSPQYGGIQFEFRVNQLCSVGEPYGLLMMGDSGSPLLYHNNIIAINWGTTPVTDDSFLNPDKLNMHINVYFYRNYIKDVVRCK